MAPRFRSDLTAGALEIVTCHAEGEVGDVIIGGYPTPPGDTLWEQSRWIARDGALRDRVLNEPRGGVFRHVNLLVPPVDPRAQAGFIIMEPVHTPPMSGSNSICVSTVLLETGIVPMVEPVTHMLIEAPGGLVAVRAECKDGKVKCVHVQNLPSFACHQGAALEVAGHGTLRVDTAFGGDSFVVVDAAALGFALTPDEAGDLAALGVKLTQAGTEQLGFTHPTNPDWRHISFCLFAGALNDQLETRHAVAIEPGKIDRSPTGTAVSARLALLHAQGRIQPGQVLTAHSLIDGQFQGRIVGTGTLGGIPTVTPEISGQAWITGHTRQFVDPTDPWPCGYRLSDTWPG